MASPTYSEVISAINTFIVTNHNNEITAEVLNPILVLLTDFTNNTIGDLNTLTTDQKDTIVNAINSLKNNFNNLANNGVQLYTGMGDPNVSPPPTYKPADFFLQVDSDSLPVQLWQFDGFNWVSGLSIIWGNITGDIQDQIDLINLIDTKDIEVLNTAKIYVDSVVVGLLDDRGSYDASTNVFPSTGGSGTGGAILKGDLWFVSVAGTLGGKAVNVGDSFRAITDSPDQDPANWSILSSNLDYVPANDANVIHTTGDEIKTGRLFMIKDDVGQSTFEVVNGLGTAIHGDGVEYGIMGTSASNGIGGYFGSQSGKGLKVQNSIGNTSNIAEFGTGTTPTIIFTSGGIISLKTLPIPVSADYDILVRNQINGNIEKIQSSNIALNSEVVHLAGIETIIGLKTFLNNTFGLRNVANTFTLKFLNSITANRTATYQDKDGVVAYLSDIPTSTYTFFLDAIIGNDSTGTVGDISKPYATINAVITAIALDTTKDYQVNIKKGTYTQTVSSPVANIVFYSEGFVTLNINIAPTALGTNTHIYNMPLAVININYNGATNTNYKLKITCATLSVVGNPHYRISLLKINCDTLILTGGTLFDVGTSSGLRLDLICQNINSTGTSIVFTSGSGTSSANIVFENATASSGSLVINTGSNTTAYIRFKKYTSASFVNAFNPGSGSNVFYDFQNSSITNGGFNPGSNGYDTCVISGKLTIINTAGGYMFYLFSQFTLVNAYIICDTNLIYRSQGLGCFKMVNSCLEIAGNYISNETVSATFTLPVLYVIGACEIFQTGTPNTFFNFHPSSTGMFLKMRGTLKMNNTGLPAGMTVTQDTTNTY